MVNVNRHGSEPSRQEKKSFFFAKSKKRTAVQNVPERNKQGVGSRGKIVGITSRAAQMGNTFGGEGARQVLLHGLVDERLVLVEHVVDIQLLFSHF
jgi:hypothetical protein